MESNSIQQININQLLENCGERMSTEGLHVFLPQQDLSHKMRACNTPFRSNHFSVLVVLEGEAKIKLNLVEYTLRKNDLFLITPNMIRQFMSMSSDFSLVALGFTPEFAFKSGLIKGQVESFDFFASRINYSLKLDDNEAANIVTLAKILQEKNARQEASFAADIIKHCFLAIMYEVAALFDKHDSSLRSRVTTRKDELVVRFLKLLSEHFKEHRSVQYYAQQLFVTPKYLSQAVKSVMGKSAGELIDDIVTMEAKLLLQDASLSIAQVANSLYFSDQFFFSKFFKKHTGQNPSDYRRAA